MTRFFIASLALAFAVWAPAFATDLDHWHKNIDLAEPNGPKEVSVSCRWEKTLVVRPYKEGPGVVLECADNAPGSD